MPDSSKAVERLHKLTQSSAPLRWILTIIGGSGFLFAMFLMIYGGLAIDRLLGRNWDLISLPSLIISSPVLILSVFLMLWSAVKFFLSQGSPMPANPPKKLVVTGLYQYTRNPMQTGVYGTLLGFSILYQSPGALLLTMGWMTLLTFWLVKVEEPELEKRLGQAYLEYKARVPRWGLRFKK